MLSARQAPFKVCKTRKKPNVGLLDAFSLFMSVLYTFNFAIGNHFPNRDSEKLNIYFLIKFLPISFENNAPNYMVEMLIFFFLAGKMFRLVSKT